MNRVLCLACLICLLVPWPLQAEDAPMFTLRDGDRVVWIGGTLVERAQQYGYLETELTRRWPDRHLEFRNLGWSGDTVFGHARARFGTVAEGFQHLKEHIEALKSTVVFVAYGANESFEGPAGLPRFREGLKTLLDLIDKTGARVVLLGPNRQEDLGRPLPDPTAHNQDLKLYNDVLRETAADRGYVFVDLYEALPDGTAAGSPHPLTDNGIHLTAEGYWQAALAIERALKLEPLNWHVTVSDADEADARGTAIKTLQRSADAVRFQALDERLPAPPPPSDAWQGVAPERVLAVEGLAPGRYTLTVDGQPVATADADAWQAGVTIDQGPEFDQVERLRQTIIRKNRLYFYRWRPQNETYLYGFRKHEQGQNAREIPLFDPLVAAQEEEIARLQKPVSHQYELIREGEVDR